MNRMMPVLNLCTLTALLDWPERDDICWVPMVHILDKINVPSTTSGRHYILNPSEVARISAKFVKRQ